MVSVPALHRDSDKAAINESSQVCRCCCRRHAGPPGKLARRQRSTVRERCEHRDSGRIAEQDARRRQIDVTLLFGHLTSMAHERFGRERNVIIVMSGPWSQT